MLVRYTMVNQASGSTGGLTAAKNRGGNYWRKRVKPLNPQTPEQYAVRLGLAAAATAWRSLTAERRLDWNAYAESLEANNAVGEPSKPSGFNAFCATNTFGALVGASQLSNAPTVSGRATLTPPDAVTFDVSDDELSVPIDTSDTWAAAAGGKFAIFISPAISAGISYYKGPYRLWETFTRGVGAPSNPLVFTPTSEPFGSITATQHRRVRIRTMGNTGRLSSAWEGVLTIQA